MKHGEIPLCVAGDGVLTPVDLIFELAVSLIRSKPWRIFAVFFWMLRGRARFQARLSEAAMVDWSALPINQQVMDLIRGARAQGRPVFLVTAGEQASAVALTRYLDVFDDVIGAGGGAGTASMILVGRFGRSGYDYIGSKKIDLDIWENARKAILVSNSRRLLRQVRAVAEIDAVIVAKSACAREYVRMFRLHQWLKNLLVFVPGMAAHRIAEISVFFRSAVAFLAFGLCASAVYILNDLADLDNDRRHRTKHNRPLAAATVSIQHALLIVPMLLVSSFWIAAALPLFFIEVLSGYFATTLLYSMWLKRQVIVDVMLLAGLYTIRVIAGATATGIQPSFWLLAFAIFLFLSLALVKRYAELNVLLHEDKARPAGRGYAVADLPVLLALGVASGFVAVLIMALYINNPDLQLAYPRAIWLWFVPGLLLYWISRMWMKTHRGEMHDDPVVFTARDWQSLIVVALIAVCFLLAAGIRRLPGGE
jgi:4-hydroxybenzoate polyprenyltransferase